MGEMDWTICPRGACGDKGYKYAMIHRGGAKESPNTCQITFSKDGQHWSPLVSTNNGDLAVQTHHGKPGLVAVPGALISSQGILQCRLGEAFNHDDGSCGASHTQREPSDVVNSGMGLLISKDGVSWQLYKKIWPFAGMYSTLAALTTDDEGAALSFGVLFSAGTLGGPSTGTVYYQNFSFTPNDLEFLV